ncbi:alpha/beta hydrolase [Chroococcidiopsis sp. FACHB-1243]|uniref:alpha/beta hydrolase n=1 Tax=Chroococcidiopsis sp. [FACHB-1243] TaxID=2692781 RepID=UPI0017870FD3|nr:alpha/beta hydrolase [Chroococcidiopsis sp. [FACHB-1243]]MBD2305392.1 alpha/beta hydrolase [Chroococcidiopsis sp. [FACHB-1243]]
MSFNFPARTWLGVVVSSLGLWFLPIPGIANSAIAAKKIYISYGAIERSISVNSLESYAKKGIVDDELATYAAYVSPQRLLQLQRVLLKRIDLSPVAVSQFLYTPTGTTLLERLGEVVQTESRQSGFYALRSALVLAAADPKGLTLLNILHKFPTNVRVNMGRMLQLAEALETLISQSRRAIALISENSTVAAAQVQGINFSQLPDLRSPGRFSWSKQTLKLSDRRRDRAFVADLYLPREQGAGSREQGKESRGAGEQGSRGAEGQLPITNYQLPITNYQRFPVIVISHGLGSDRTSFIYLAEQLASYGFAVAVPEHPGSNAEQLRSLFSGQAAEVAEPSEFVNRPLDVKYLLDELERLNVVNPDWQLNVQRAAIIGQSFGGYTALALAGASLNFSQLRQDCNNPKDIWNLSLLLQCRALALPLTQDNLKDWRIKAAIAINPFTSSIFGELGLRKIQIPVAIVSSSADTIAPALPEQIIPFAWLTTERKYLISIDRASHFSTIGESAAEDADPIPLPAQVIGPNPAIARRYVSILSVAFMETYLDRNPQYRPYLSSSYIQTISQAPLDVSLVSSLPLTQLANSICAVVTAQQNFCPQAYRRGRKES